MAIPPSSSMAAAGLRFNGTGTCVDGSESDFDVGGGYWYSTKVNLPSGGTNDNLCRASNAGAYRSKG